MLKSFLLSSTRPFYAPDDEKGSDKQAAIDAERKAIKVESFTKDAPKQDASANTNNEDDDKGSDASDTSHDDDKEEDVEDDSGSHDDDKEEKEDDEKEAKTLTPEELQKQIEKLERTINRLQKRQGKTASERDQIRQQLADAQAALNAKVEQGEGLTEEEVERRANLKAEEKAAEREFAKAVSNLNKAATKADAEFPTKIKELTEDVAPIPGAMIGILEDLDNGNGGAVLAYLADNPDEYEEIFEMPLTRMANRLNKISDKVAEAAKPKKKAISKAPAPINGIKGGEKSPTILPPNPTKDMDTFVRMRREQVEQRRKARLG